MHGPLVVACKGDWYCPPDRHGLSCPVASDEDVEEAARLLAEETFKDLDLEGGQ